VAVTHFAPSLRSSDPRGMVPGTAGFCNALDDLLPCAQLAARASAHPVDYTAQGLRADGSAWQCRVHANPLGYAQGGRTNSTAQSGSMMHCRRRASAFKT
jgi:hypothetical protein